MTTTRSAFFRIARSNALARTENSDRRSSHLSHSLETWTRAGRCCRPSFHTILLTSLPSGASQWLRKDHNTERERS